jgi:S1-C subfamily serine protease
MDSELLDAYSRAVIDATRRVAPAVVHLEIAAQPGGKGPRGTGSGFLFTPDGLLLTNSHVVHGSRDIRVTNAEGDSTTGDLVGDDPDSDLAIVRIGATRPDGHRDRQSAWL